jgi:hypothetical protein
MMAKTIITKHRPKTPSRPAFCFIDICKLYINLIGIAITMLSVKF